MQRFVSVEKPLLLRSERHRIPQLGGSFHASEGSRGCFRLYLTTVDGAVKCCMTLCTKILGILVV